MSTPGSSGSGADPSKLPAHLRPMIRAGSKPAGGSATAGTPGSTTDTGGGANGAKAAAEPAGAATTDDQGNSFKVFIRNWWFLLFVMPVLIFLRCNVWSPYKIPTGSMEPELLGNDDNGDRVLVNLFAYKGQDPQRWDIAVFKSPELKSRAKTTAETKDTEYVKRCVGIPGDRIVVSGGDLYDVRAGADGKDSFELLRKPADLQKGVWHTLYNFPYTFTWEAPTPLIRHGEWEVTPETACTPAADQKSFRLKAAGPDAAWTLTMKRTADPVLWPQAETAPVAGPAGPVAGPELPPEAADAKPALKLSFLTNRYLKTGDYWFRVPNTSLAPFRAHIRGSETVLLVPDDIHPEYPDNSAAQAAEVRQWKGKRLYPIPLTWYAGNGEIESHTAQSERQRNAELWRLSEVEKARYLAAGPDEPLGPDIALKADAYRGTSLRIGECYGGVFGANDIRVELKLVAHSWGSRVRLVFDQEMSADGSQVLRRYGFTVEKGVAQPWVEEWSATAGVFAPVVAAAGVAGAPASAAPIGVGEGPQRWALEHYDGMIRLVRLDYDDGTKELDACGFAYNPPPRAMKQHNAGLYLEGQGADLEIQRLKIARDLYYLWDEFKIMADNGVTANLVYRLSNENFPQMPDGYLLHRADGLTEFNLTANAGSPQGRYLMFGDNTVSSIDSRYFGPVERWRFIGKYWFTFWPPSRARAVR